MQDHLLFLKYLNTQLDSVDFNKTYSTLIAHGEICSDQSTFVKFPPTFVELHINYSNINFISQEKLFYLLKFYSTGCSPLFLVSDRFKFVDSITTQLAKEPIFNSLTILPRKFSTIYDLLVNLETGEKIRFKSDYSSKI